MGIVTAQIAAMALPGSAVMYAALAATERTTETNWRVDSPPAALEALRKLAAKLDYASATP